mmetsp:Transcript_125833/g.218123  ORF Transcript_125833/g.218123 Transcript_125833/m.218123 type:complete len:81 (+) Transcript_125833:355-597(+)
MDKEHARNNHGSLTHAKDRIYVQFLDINFCIHTRDIISTFVHIFVQTKEILMLRYQTKSRDYSILSSPTPEVNDTLSLTY